MYGEKTEAPQIRGAAPQNKEEAPLEDDESDAEPQASDAPPEEDDDDEIREDPEAEEEQEEEEGEEGEDTHAVVKAPSRNPTGKGAPEKNRAQDVDSDSEESYKVSTWNTGDSLHVLLNRVCSQRATLLVRWRRATPRCDAPKLFHLKLTFGVEKAKGGLFWQWRRREEWFHNQEEQGRTSIAFCIIILTQYSARAEGKVGWAIRKTMAVIAR